MSSRFNGSMMKGEVMYLSSVSGTRRCQKYHRGSSLAAGVGTSLPPAWVPTSIVLPSGANVTHHTLDFTASGPCCSPLAFTSQSFTTPSRLPVASRVPSGEKAALVTQSLWPARVANSFESEVFQSLIVRSEPAVASFEPSGE